MSGHTAGPWFADGAGRIWRRHPTELYQNGGGVAGDRPLANANQGWFGEDEEGYPLEANARLIAAAPELLEALEWLTIACQPEGGGERFKPTPEALVIARAAIAKATQSESDQ